MKCFVDAAVNGNPGLGGVGFVVQNEEMYEQVALPLPGTWNNHLAEFEACYLALQWLLDRSFSDSLVFIYTDSKIVVDSLEKQYARNADFMVYVKKITTLLEKFTFAEVLWIPEEKNKGADRLARQGLQKAKKS